MGWLCWQSAAKGSLGSNSLIRGKIQGNFVDSAAKAQWRLGFPTIDQLVAPKFPTHPNRELFPAEQGIIHSINAEDGVFGTHRGAVQAGHLAGSGRVNALRELMIKQNRLDR